MTERLNLSVSVPGASKPEDGMKIILRNLERFPIIRALKNIHGQQVQNPYQIGTEIREARDYYSTNGFAEREDRRRALRFQAVLDTPEGEARFAFYLELAPTDERCEALREAMQANLSKFARQAMEAEAEQTAAEVQAATEAAPIPEAPKPHNVMDRVMFVRPGATSQPQA